MRAGTLVLWRLRRSKLGGSGPRLFQSTVEQVYTHYAAAVAGVPYEMLKAASRRAWAVSRPELFDFVVPFLEELRRRGYVAVLISGSPEEAVEVAAADLGIQYSYGARVAVAAGRCLARLERAPGYPGEKLRCLQVLRERVPLDLSRSLAIGDSASDIELLNVVGYPAAFEPDMEMATVARERGWPCVDRETVLQVSLGLLVENG
ncbi:haloacid dehalogenase-like hydrolase [Streptomyces sp. TRM 70351]|uniref:HAD family hydrolase n=1 Tax=Streptomyces sp. TRM 70351 TaxID=3116552 RepID=UPI002E7BAE21|nr:haloacid dehalogenase-like hydrolase [Streptomyces sp. TRM 70351]MEE1926860.1 haloacid dehalogenase-like hydrolase [Streptomyces sp. TRM 70351]